MFLQKFRICCSASSPLVKDFQDCSPSPTNSCSLPDSPAGEAEPLRLDPAVFPRRLELQLSTEAHEQLLRLAAESGRSPSELAEHLISQSLQQGPALPGRLDGEAGDQVDPADRS